MDGGEKNCPFSTLQRPKIFVSMNRFLPQQRVASVLDQLELRKKITKHGKQSILHLIDPFHDFEEDTAGFPDADGSLSSCQWQVSTLQLSKPAGTVGNWDCCVANLPFQYHSVRTGVANSLVAPAELYRSGKVTPGTNTTQFWHPVMVTSADTGQSLFDTTSANWETHGVSVKPVGDLTSKSSRVIALGFEVHNTTASLNKQGTVTVLQMSQNPRKMAIPWVNSGNTQSGVRDAYYFRCPPDTIEEAIRYPNAKQWEAAEGVMCVPTLMDTLVPVEMPQNCEICMLNYNDVPGSDTSGAVLASNPEWVTAGASSQWQGGWMQPAHFNTCCALFTGLSPETTLTVTCRALVEYFPYVGDTLLANATPSPPLDNAALRIYSEVVRHMPAGVPVDMNAKGDWWRMALKIIGNAVSVLGPVIGTAADAVIPGAAALGVATGAAGAAMANLSKGQKKRQRKQRMLQARNASV